MDSRKLAQCYDSDVGPGWDERFVPLLLEAFPDELPAKANLLELCCATGRLTEEILERLPAQGRVIAIEDGRELMELAKQRVAEVGGRRVFFKKEAPEKITFADATFDGVLAAGLPPIYDLRKVLAEAARLLKPNGFLLLGVPLQGSFQELFDALREVAEKEDLIPVQDGLDRIQQRLPERVTANRWLQEAGLVETRTRVQAACLAFPGALALLQSPLVRAFCLEGCMALIPDRSWREGVLAGMVKALDTYFPAGIELSLNLGRLEATKA
jgi:SAM-dependent methyltransferase